MEAAADLPPGFAELARFLPDWGDLHSEDDRYRLRQTKGMAELRDFYDAMVPQLAPIFDHLDRFAYGPLPDPEARLLRLALALAEVAQAVEVIGRPTVPSAPAGHSIPVIRASKP